MTILEMTENNDVKTIDAFTNAETEITIKFENDRYALSARFDGELWHVSNARNQFYAPMTTKDLKDMCLERLSWVRVNKLTDCELRIMARNNPDSID